MSETRMTVPEVAAYLGVGRTTVQRMLRAGTIPNVRVGKLFLISREAFERWWAAAGKAAE